MNRKSRQRGEGMLGLLIVAVLIAIGFFLYFRSQKSEPMPKRVGGPTTYVGQSLEKGSEVDCRNNLKQIRTAITMEKMQSENETPPATLPSLRSQGFGPQMLKCSVTQQPYQYNAQTGQVWCPTPGHEKF